MSRLRGLAVLALLATACGGSTVGPTGGGDAAPPPLDIVLPAVTFTARSQLWAPTYDGLAPGTLHLYWLDAPDACGDPEGLVQRAGVPWLEVTVVSPAVGVACPVIDPGARETPDGCRAYVGARLLDDRGWIYESPAGTGTVRIARADGGRLSGTVRATFPDSLFQSGCSWASSGSEIVDGSCTCVEPGGTRTCSFTGSADTMCCDDGSDPVEVELPFEADACGAAAGCWGSPCPALAIGEACEPSPAPPRNCAQACAGFDRVCLDCSGCAPDDGECLAFAGCDVSACLDACMGVFSHDPTFATALRCLAASGGCDSWRSCMAHCGD